MTMKLRRFRWLLGLLGTCIFTYLMTPAGELTKADILAGGVLGLFKLNVILPAWVAWVIVFAVFITGVFFGKNSNIKGEEFPKPNFETKTEDYELTESQKSLIDFFKENENNYEHAEDIAKKLKVKEIQVQHDLNELEKFEYIYCSYNDYHGNIYKLTKKGVAFAVNKT